MGEGVPVGEWVWEAEPDTVGVTEGGLAELLKLGVPETESEGSTDLVEVRVADRKKERLEDAEAVWELLSEGHRERLTVGVVVTEGLRLKSRLAVAVRDGLGGEGVGVKDGEGRTETECVAVLVTG